MADLKMLLLKKTKEHRSGGVESCPHKQVTVVPGRTLSNVSAHISHIATKHLDPVG